MLEEQFKLVAFINAFLYYGKEFRVKGASDKNIREYCTVQLKAILDELVKKGYKEHIVKLVQAVEQLHSNTDELSKATIKELAKGGGIYAEMFIYNLLYAGVNQNTNE